MRNSLQQICHMEPLTLDKPKISVITCTYNSESFVSTNLDSVWNADHPHEQIIVDAYSEDKTIDIVNKSKGPGCNIKILFRRPRGISDAMNYGIRNASGNIIQVLHSDDYNLDRKLYGKIRETFRTQNCKWLYGLTKTIDEKDRPVGEQPPKFFRTYRFWMLPFVNYIPHPSLFIKKVVFEEYGLFDTNLRLIMDWDFWLRIGKKYTPLIVNEHWCAFRRHKESLSRKEAFSRKLHEEEKMLLRKHFPMPFGTLLYLLHYALYFWRHYKNRSLT